MGPNPRRIWRYNLCETLPHKSGEIAVLSPCLRQLVLRRRKIASMFDVVVGGVDQEALDEMEEEEADVELPTKQGKKDALLSEVRVVTMDNFQVNGQTPPCTVSCALFLEYIINWAYFQGEEAKVIIISMVRSNKKNKCGVLKTSNRINVLLRKPTPLPPPNPFPAQSPPLICPTSLKLTDTVRIAGRSTECTSSVTPRPAAVSRCDPRSKNSSPRTTTSEKNWSSDVPASPTP